MRAARVLPLLVVAGLLAVLAQQRVGPTDTPAPVWVERLRTEYANNPLGIDVSRPRLGWILRSDQRDQHQTAFQVQAATSRERLESGTPDLWDSGRVHSANSTQVLYRGRLLPSSTQAFWRVRVWDTAGRPSSWSSLAWWETAIMRPADWNASWIGARIGTHGPDPLLRKEVVLPKQVVRARAYVVGLGNYELYLNGHRVGTRVLDPAFTDYRRRVLYSTYDVTSMLKAGRNAVGIALGRGRYALTTPNTWRFHTAPWRGDPRALLRLSIWFADGTQDAITTDGSWTTNSGPTRFDSVYAGEIYDARYARTGWDRPGYRASGWTRVALLPAPAGRLQAQALEPMRVVETFTPASIATPKPGVHVVDMGRTMAGWVRLHARGRAGAKVTLRYAERLHPDGTVNNDQPSIAAPIQTDIYILAGRGEEVWEPRFSYKGFRYVELRGLPAAPALGDVEGRVVRSSLASIGGLWTSDESLNRIHRATRVALAGNLHGIPTDTPVYEKNGWLGDMHLLAETTVLNFDAARFLTKGLRQ